MPDRATAISSPPGPGARDFSIAADDGWSDIFSKVLAAAIEPRLGLGRLTLLTDYPRSEAALARPKLSDPRLSERFELYACGVELANGFGELTDPAEQRARFEAEMAEKERVYGERYPLDEDFLAALAHMPPSIRRGAGVRPAGDAGSGGTPASTMSCGHLCPPIREGPDLA